MFQGNQVRKEKNIIIQVVKNAGQTNIKKKVLNEIIQNTIGKKKFGQKSKKKGEQ